jgi:hypothetical protein
MCQNAEYQLRALTLGAVTPLHRGETKLAGPLSLMPNVVSRTWEYWSTRVGGSATISPRRRATKARRGIKPKRRR